MTYKLPKEIKRRMEKEIRQYDFNKQKLEDLKAKGTSRQLLYIEERLYHVETAYNQLREEEKAIYSLIFKSNCNWLYCQTIHNIDKDTYYNVYNKSLYFLAQEWGEI